MFNPLKSLFRKPKAAIQSALATSQVAKGGLCEEKIDYACIIYLCLNMRKAIVILFWEECLI